MLKALTSSSSIADRMIRFEINTSAWEANHLLKSSSRLIVFSSHTLAITRVGNPIPRRQSIITRDATQCASAAATTNT
uniref:Uncharacterized protein n=1 Tax=Solanum lycopersicum TaxID=4081 RepID=A0A3Q7H6M5_SOLLC